MFTLEECQAGVDVAMAMPGEQAMQVYDTLRLLPDVSVVFACLPSDESDTRRVAALLFGGAYHRLQEAYLVAPWFVNRNLGDSALRGVALWPSNEATKNALNGGTIT